MKKYSEGEIILNEVDHLHYREGAGDTVEIFDIAVNSNLRKGIGSRMIKMLEQKYQGKHIFAITHSANEIAQRFYKKNGFVGTLLPKFYPVFPPYTSGDAYMFIK